MQQYLDDTLQHIEPRELPSWAENYISCCQIDALAAAVLDGLQTDPDALHVIQKLCKCIPYEILLRLLNATCPAAIVAFRDAILRQRPTLLAALLEKCNEVSQNMH